MKCNSLFANCQRIFLCPGEEPCINNNHFTSGVLAGTNMIGDLCLNVHDQFVCALPKSTHKMHCGFNEEGKQATWETVIREYK